MCVYIYIYIYMYDWFTSVHCEEPMKGDACVAHGQLASSESNKPRINFEKQLYPSLT